MNGKKAKLLRKIAKQQANIPTTYVEKTFHKTFAVNTFDTSGKPVVEHRPYNVYTRVLGNCTRFFFQQMKKAYKQQKLNNLQQASA